MRIQNTVSIEPEYEYPYYSRKNIRILMQALWIRYQLTGVVFANIDPAQVNIKTADCYGC